MWFATNRPACDDVGCPGTVATKLMFAVCAPCTLLQSTVNHTRTSGLPGLTLPFVGEMCSHDALLVTVNVNACGPPRPTSTKRFLKGVYGSSVSVGGGQL